MCGPYCTVWVGVCVDPTVLYGWVCVCVERGERVSDCPILMEDDIIDWDDQHPPSMGEERIQRMSWCCITCVHLL